MRIHTPVSFEMLTDKIGIFKYNPIISLEELKQISRISAVTQMPMYPVELLHGSEKTLQSLQPNNQKYENLLVMSEDEQ